MQLHDRVALQLDPSKKKKKKRKEERRKEKKEKKRHFSGGVIAATPLYQLNGQFLQVIEVTNVVMRNYQHDSLVMQ